RVAEGVDLPDPDQLRSVSRLTGSPRGTVLGPGGRLAGDDGRERAVPRRRSPALARSLGEPSRTVERRSFALGGDVGNGVKSNRRAAARPARGDAATGRGRVDLGRGLRSAGYQRSQSTGTASSSTSQSSRGARTLRLRRNAMTNGSTPDLACKEVVELVTDYLEQTLSHDERTRFEQHLAIC